MITESGSNHVRVPFIAGICGYIAHDDDDYDSRDENGYHYHHHRS